MAFQLNAEIIKIVWNSQKASEYIKKSETSVGLSILIAKMFQIGDI